MSMSVTPNTINESNESNETYIHEVIIQDTLNISDEPNESDEPAVCKVNIRDTEEFKIFYEKCIMPKFRSRSSLQNSFRCDSKQDQFLLCDKNPSSHVYQYNIYLKTINPSISIQR